MRSKSANPRAVANGAFTLVELLVVIAIILLLAGILVPTVASALKMGAKASCQTRIGELSDGCAVYKQDNYYYPGRQNLDWVAAGKSGAQLLADAMFTKVTNGQEEWPTSNYATYKESDLLTSNDHPAYEGTISDTFPQETMPILYYPSRINQIGCGQYDVSDNGSITNVTGPWSQDSFEEFILDPRFGADMPHGNKEFLIIAAGVDALQLERTFSDNDNQVSWSQ